MGGYGSGNHKYDKKTTVMECKTVWLGQVSAWAQDHNMTLREIAASGGFPLVITWRSGRRTTQRLSLAWGPVGRYGALRPYLACPTCGRRAFVLYLPHNAAEGQPFACRTCWRLVYPTQQRRLTRLDRLMASALVGDDGLPDLAAALRYVDTRRMLGGAFGFDAWARKYQNVFAEAGA